MERFRIAPQPLPPTPIHTPHDPHASQCVRERVYRMVTGLAVDCSSDRCSGGGSGVCQPVPTFKGSQGGLPSGCYTTGGILGFNRLRSSIGLRWQPTLMDNVMHSHWCTRCLQAAAADCGPNNPRPSHTSPTRLAGSLNGVLPHTDRGCNGAEWQRRALHSPIYITAALIISPPPPAAANGRRRWRRRRHCRRFTVPALSCRPIRRQKTFTSAGHDARPVQNRPFINRWRAPAPARPAAAGPAVLPRAAKRPAGKGRRPTAVSPELTAIMSSTGRGRRAAALACAHRVWRASTRRARGAPSTCRTAMSNRPFSFVDRSEALAHHPHSSGLPALAASPPRCHYHPLPTASG